MKLLHSPLALFVAQAAVILLLSRLIGLLARWLRQPMVIAEIIAGILLGPSLLGWLAPNFSAVLFPKESLPLLSMMSQVGLVLFMFLIGLELDPKLLRGRTHSSVAISHSSIILPFGLGALLALYVYPRLAPPHVPYSSFVLFMGVAMSITAFPVLARILIERRLLRSKVGAVTIACAAVDDVTAWCILAFVVSIVRSANLAGAVRTSVLAVGYVGLMLAIVRPFFERIADRGRLGLSQNLVAAVLFLLLVSSWTTELIGIHALFGAFLFGAILPKQGSLASALAEKIEDLVVVFFLPLFFAYSGLRTQIGLVNSPSGWFMCALVIGTACLGKFGGSVAAGKLTGLSWREATAIGILMNTRGLMELIVLNIGLDLGVISPALFAIMVMMALVTTFMTTPLLQVVYPIEEIATQLAGADAERSGPQSFAGYTALVCVAYEQSGPTLLTIGAAIAGKRVDGKSHSRLYALRLVRPADRPSFLLDQRESGGEVVENDSAFAPLMQRAEELEVDVHPLSFVSTEPGKDIRDVANVKKADIILLGWHKPMVGATMLSGTVHEVMTGATADVGVLVDRGLLQVGNLLVPYLGLEHDRAALRIARRIAENTGATATILHVVSPSGTAEKKGVEARVREEFVQGEGASRYKVIFKVVPHEVPAEAVVEESNQGHDLMIIGLGKQWGLEHRSFGLLPETILKRSPISVLVLRGPSAPEPVPAASSKTRPRLASVPPTAHASESKG